MIFLIENPFNKFLQENALWIALSFAFIIVITLAVIFLNGRKKESSNRQFTFNADAFIKALGGQDNFTNAEAKGSRLSLTIKDKNLLNEENLKKNGVLSLIKMSNKVVLVVDGSAEKFKQKIINS